MRRVLHDSLFRIESSEGISGWLTRDIKSKGGKRDLILFDDANAGRLLDVADKQTFELLKHTLTGLRTDGVGSTDALKSYLNSMDSGEAPLYTRIPSVVEAIYKFGPVPALVFREVDGYRHAIFPRLPHSASNAPMHTDLLGRVRAYDRAGFGILIVHYLEQIAARLHDVSVLRDPSLALIDLDRIREEIHSSLFGKLSEVQRLVQDGDRNEKAVAEDILLRNRQAFILAHFSSHLALYLIAEYFNIFGIGNGSATIDQSASRHYGDIDYDGQYPNELSKMYSIWESYNSWDIQRLEELSGNYNDHTSWVQQFAEFAYFVADLRAAKKGASGRKWWAPGIFFSFNFKATTSPAVARVIEKLSALSNLNGRIFRPIVSKADHLRDLQRQVRQRIYESDWTLALLPAQSTDRNPDRYAFIAREIEHSRLLGHNVALAVESGSHSEVNHLHDWLGNAKIDWLVTDPRLPTDRHKDVRSITERGWIVFDDSLPGDSPVDARLLQEISAELPRLANSKIKRLLSFWVHGIKPIYRLAAVAMALEAWDYPATRADLVAKLRRSGILLQKNQFTRVREQINKASLQIGDESFLMVEYNSPSGYRTRWMELLLALEVHNSEEQKLLAGQMKTHLSLIRRKFESARVH